MPYTINSDQEFRPHVLRCGFRGHRPFFTFMLARYGIRGIFMSGRPSRILLFLMFSVLILYGGFRLSFITCALIFSFQFYLERLHQTRLLAVFAFIGVIVVTLCVPFANKLPYTFQRSLAFLPLKIDPEAKWDAESSSNWRVMIWKAMLPQVPHYLLLGKGYAAFGALTFKTVRPRDFRRGTSAADWSATIVGNYHNGPLSVVIFFRHLGRHGICLVLDSQRPGVV